MKVKPIACFTDPSSILPKLLELMVVPPFPLMDVKVQTGVDLVIMVAAVNVKVPTLVELEDPSFIEPVVALIGTLTFYSEYADDSTVAAIALFSK